MLISAPGNVKQAIGDILIELKGNAHQIRYKPTQQKNSKVENMFPGVLAGLCNKGIICSIRHGLKTCKKTLCNAKKFTIKANMDCYHLPLPIMNWYFKQVTPPKAISDLESGEYLFNKLTEFKKNGCKILAIEFNPVDYCRMAPVWDLFINWEKCIKSLVSGSKYKSFCLQGNVTPIQSRINAGIQSIMSTIAPRFVTVSTRHLSTFNILLHLQWPIAPTHPAASLPCATNILIWSLPTMATSFTAYLYYTLNLQPAAPL